MCRTVVMAVAVVGLLLGSEALAQRDAGAKARGEYGKGFWSSGSNRRATSTVPRRMMSPTRPTYSIAESPAAESYRSFSYEPAPEATNGATNSEEAPVEVSAAPTPCPTAPTVTYRRYSYEPAVANPPRCQVRRSAAQRRTSPPEARLRPGSRSY